MINTPRHCILAATPNTILLQARVQINWRMSTPNSSAGFPLKWQCECTFACSPSLLAGQTSSGLALRDLREIFFFPVTSSFGKRRSDLFAKHAGASWNVNIAKKGIKQKCELSRHYSRTDSDKYWRTPIEYSSPCGVGDSKERAYPS